MQAIQLIHKELGPQPLRHPPNYVRIASGSRSPNSPPTRGFRGAVFGKQSTLGKMLSFFFTNVLWCATPQLPKWLSINAVWRIDKRLDTTVLIEHRMQHCCGTGLPRIHVIPSSGNIRSCRR